MPVRPKEGPLTHRYTITLPQSLAEEIEKTKELHGVQAVNSWLRSLWIYGLEKQKDEAS